MLNRMLRQVYPPICVLCGEHGHSDLNLCNACHQDLVLNKSACIHCACPIGAEAHGQICGQCLQKKTIFDRAWSPFLYAQPLEWMIHQFKFNAKLFMGNVLSMLLLQHLPELKDKPDCIIPIPLHASRLKQRGYNQAMELARPIGERLGSSLITKVVANTYITQDRRG